VKERLLVRITGRGTVVRPLPKKITQIGLYHRLDISSQPGEDHSRTVQASLAKILEARRIGLRVWTDTRPEREKHLPLESLVKAASHREIQGLIGANIGLKEMQWLEKLPVITAVAIIYPSSHSVSIDFAQLAQLFVKALADKGVKSIGLFTHLPLAKPSHLTTEPCLSKISFD